MSGLVRCNMQDDLRVLVRRYIDDSYDFLYAGRSWPFFFLGTPRLFPIRIIRMSVIQLWVHGRNVGGIGTFSVCQNWIAFYQVRTVRWFAVLKIRSSEDALGKLWPISKTSMILTGPLFWTVLSPCRVHLINSTPLPTGRIGRAVCALRCVRAVAAVSFFLGGSCHESEHRYRFTTSRSYFTLLVYRLRLLGPWCHCRIVI